MKQIEQTEVEELSHDAPSIDIDASATLSVEADGLQETLEDNADGFDVTGFKCARCSLAHMHDTTKHRLSDSFDISEADASSMEYNSVCHCGLQEAGRHGSDYGIDESKATRLAGNAPIPPEASREMNEQFGSL